MGDERATKILVTLVTSKRDKFADSLTPKGPYHKPATSVFHTPRESEYHLDRTTGALVRIPLLVVALSLLSPSLGLADDGVVPRAPERALEEFQRWTEQRRLEESVRLEDQKRDAERTFDRIQEEIRVHRIEQRLDQLEASRSAR